MSYLSEQQVDRISNLLREVEKLSDVEKLLLYLQLPCGRAEPPEAGKYKLNGSKHGADIFSKKPDQETTQTYTWILSHLEEDQNVSLPKQEVYDEYRAFCQANRFEPLCVADFGKAMKHALPCIKPRRLGQRGNSRYCYSGLRKKYRIEPPTLPDMIELIPAHRQPASYQNDSGFDLNGSRSREYQRTNSNYDQCPTTKAAIPSSASSTSPTSSTSSSSSTTSSSSSPLATTSNRRPTHQTINVNKQDVMNLKQEPCELLDNCPAGGQQQQHQEPTCCRQDDAQTASIGCSMIAANGNGPIYGSTSQPDHQEHNQRLLRPPPVNQEFSVVPQSHQQQPPPPQHQQQQPHHHHHQATSQRYEQASYHDCQPRPGTPDDDDYRHNYHDLNRPMVGPAIIPFSQSLPAQLAQQPASHESFLSYNTIPYSSAAIVQSPYQQQQQQQQQLQMRHPQAKLVATTPLGDNPSCRPHQEIVPDCCSNERIKQDKILDGVPTPRQPFEQIGGNNQPSVHDGSPEIDQCQVGARNQFEHSSSASKYPTHAHLNLNFNEPVMTTDMDFASPFQSPASTPYPIISSTNYLPETQDYCSSDCKIQYTTDQ